MKHTRKKELQLQKNSIAEENKEAKRLQVQKSKLKKFFQILDPLQNEYDFIL